jgi:hypothetical protein
LNVEAVARSVIVGYLDRRIGRDQVPPENIPLNSPNYKDPIRIPHDCVVFNNVVCINGSGKTNPEITPLGRIAISN